MLMEKKLTNLSFANDVALFNKKEKQKKCKNLCQDQSSMELFLEKIRKYSKTDNSPYHSKNK